MVQQNPRSGVRSADRAEYERLRPPRQLINTTFTVSGRGTFPFDMLRYESCVPATEDDARLIGEQRALEAEAVEITLMHPGAKSWQPTAGRWEALGWSVDAGRVKKAEGRV